MSVNVELLKHEAISDP